MLSFYFIAQTSSGRHGSLDFSLVRLPLTYHLSKQYGCPKKNQVILLHVYLVSSETVAYAPVANWLPACFRALRSFYSVADRFGRRLRRPC